MVWSASAVLVPAAWDAREVLRHKRSLPSSADTVIARSVKFDMYAVPVSAFSGP